MLSSFRSFQLRPLGGVKRECSSNQFEVRSSGFGLLSSDGASIVSRRRARPLAAHNADNPAGGSPAMVNDDKPSSYNRRG